MQTFFSASLVASARFPADCRALPSSLLAPCQRSLRNSPSSVQKEGLREDIGHCCDVEAKRRCCQNVCFQAHVRFPQGRFVQSVQRKSLFGCRRSCSISPLLISPSRDSSNSIPGTLETSKSVFHIRASGSQTPHEPRIGGGSRSLQGKAREIYETRSSLVPIRTDAQIDVGQGQEEICRVKEMQ